VFVVAWDNVESNKATEKQIKYAEALLESYYGDICYPIYTMNKKDISNLIDDTKKKCQEKGIDYHNSMTEAVHGVEEEGIRPTLTHIASIPTSNFATRMYEESMRRDIEYYPTFTSFNVTPIPAVETAIQSRIMTDEELKEDINRCSVFNVYVQPIDGRYKIDMTYRDVVFTAMFDVYLITTNNLDAVLQFNKTILKEKAFQRFRGIVSIRNTILRNTTDELLLHERYLNSLPNPFCGVAQIDTL
jgi:hypothetical protein